VFVTALCAPTGAQPQDEAELTRLARDPDRGLSEALRRKLRLADPLLDEEWPTEVWAARVGPHLRALREAWALPDPAARLAQERWIPADLRVGALAPAELEPALARGPWTVSRASGPSPAEHALPAAFAAWRAAFGADAHLELEVFEVEPDPDAAVVRVRATASGPGGPGRVQHSALWASRWRRGEQGPELAALELERFEAATFAGAAAGLFEDVTAAALAGEAEVARQLGAGLDDWRRTIPAALEPGTLGHHGLALGDVDGDGLEDLYLCQPGGLPNRLLLHRPDGGLRDVSAAAGVDFLDYSSSALLADLDNDGDVDLIVATAVGLVFLANDGKGVFERRLVRERSLATSLAAADFDADGDLDVYACSYLSPYEHDDLPMPYHLAENGEANQLLRNDGAWSFVDATAELGLDENNRRFSFAAAWEDFDDDGDQDLYVANDFGRNNLYRQQDGRFRDVAAELGVEDVSAGMGVSWSDADGDGRMDLYVTNMYTPAASRLTGVRGFRADSSPQTRAALRAHAMGNSLLLNRGAEGFVDRAEQSGTGLGRWGWGALFVDFDNDGAPDLFAPNGFSSGEREDDLDSFFWRQVVLRSPDAIGEPSEEYALGWRAVNRLVRQGWSWNGRERNVAWLNLGAADFADVSGLTGLDLPDDARAAARIDWDGDGDLDLLVTNRGGPQLRLLANRHDGARDWIAFELSGGDARRTAVGARVTLTTSGGRTLVAGLRCGEGFLAQSSSQVHFGLGEESVTGIAVRWPDGAREDFGAPAAGARWRLERGTGAARALERAAQPRMPPGALAPASRTRSARTVLPAPLPMTRLALETTDGRPATILGLDMSGPRGTGRPLALLVWDSAFAPGLQAFVDLTAAADELLAAQVQVLAVLTDEAGQRERGLELLRGIGWPFSAGFASEEALLVLEQIQGALHDSHAGLLVPACFLISPRGELLAVYEGRFEPRRLLADLALAESEPAARRDAAVPFPGRWIAPPPEPAQAALASRLAAHGLERAAAEYRLARVEAATLSAADFHVELGLVRQRQGRLDDAARHFREALAADPGSARARASLGALLVGSGDLAGARVELEALRALQSELATELEQQIRAAQSDG
jgi:tetratricopeptide (TPR) repeat protein